MMKISPITHGDYQEILALFNDPFYFQTSYPAMVSADELFNYLIHNHTFSLICNKKISGLGLYKEHNSQYVFMKIKLSSNNSCTSLYHHFLSDFIKLIKNNVPHVHRIETMVFDFEAEDLNILQQSHFKQEAIKKNEVYKEGKLRSVHTFSLIGGEIDKYLSIN